jgi:hypothetical protein
VQSTKAVPFFCEKWGLSPFLCTPAPAAMAGTGGVDYRTIAVFMSVTISAAESARL